MSSLTDLERVLQPLLAELGTARAITVSMLLASGTPDSMSQLVGLAPPELPPFLTDVSARRWLGDLRATELLRKSDVVTTIDTAGVARKKAVEAEAACFATNCWVNQILFMREFCPETRTMIQHDEDLLEDRDRLIRAFFLRVRGRIARWLGPVERFYAISDVLSGFGKGSTFHDTAPLNTVPDKIANLAIGATSAFPWELLQQWRETAWARAQLRYRYVNLNERCRAVFTACEPERVRGNRFATVPKDGRTDRAIAIEPSLNLFYQLALGEYLKRRLYAQGLDLRSGQDLHRRMAMEASRSGSHATIDLSSASDTISHNLVRFLLPNSWFRLLDGLRSPFTKGMVEGKWTRNWKHSSMGNGYTFELETIIFAAISQQALIDQDCPHRLGEDLTVYGDDIIVPTPGVRGVLAALARAGFTVNTKKTFTSGWFRESCGGDFLDGREVRPLYIKGIPHEPQHWIGLANGILRMARQDARPDDHPAGFRKSWHRCLDLLPSAIRSCRGPVALGDLLIHDREESWNYRVDHSIRKFRTYLPVTEQISWDHWSPDTQLAAALYGCSSNAVSRESASGVRELLTAGGVTPRGGVTGYRLGWTCWS